MDVNPTTVTELHRGTLAEQLGVRFVEVSRDRVVAELPYTFREALTTVGGSLHGGTLMAFADTVGAVATMLNSPSGAATITIESKIELPGGRSRRDGSRRDDATPSGQTDDGLANPRDRRERSPALTHRANPDGA